MGNINKNIFLQYIYVYVFFIIYVRMFAKNLNFVIVHL